MNDVKPNILLVGLIFSVTLIFVMLFLLCKFEDDSIFSIFSIGWMILSVIAFFYYDNIYNKQHYTINKTVLLGIVKEKYVSNESDNENSNTIYKTTIEINDKDDTYVITINDEDAFDNNIIGSKISIEKETILNNKDNSIIETNYNYINNHEKH